MCKVCPEIANRATLLRLSILCSLLSGILLIVPAQQVNVRGRVRNQAGQPAQGLIMTLVKAQLVDTTDSNGYFSLRRSATSVHQALRPSVTFHGQQLRVDVSTPISPVSVDLFGPHGALITKLFEGVLLSGSHEICFSSALQNIPSSILVLRLKVDGKVSWHTLVNSGVTGLVSSPKVSYSWQNSYNTAGSSADRLEIRRSRGLDTIVLISSYQDSLNLQFDLIPWETLDRAVAEVSRYPSEVGKGLTTYPFDLARYLTKIGEGVNDYEKWCSEFVSWAYRAGGYPFTGGTQGGWMLRSTTPVKTWFQANTEFVDRTNPKWNTFIPAPGDYIRFENSTDGHSGMVRYVSRDTLYTVEGNVSNVVRLRAIPQWKTYDTGTRRIDGIGRRSGTRRFVP